MEIRAASPAQEIRGELNAPKADFCLAVILEVIENGTHIKEATDTSGRNRDGSD